MINHIKVIKQGFYVKFNMHNYFDYTIDVCTQADKAFAEDMISKRKKERKQAGDSTEDEITTDVELLDHNCHRHWAFALFKRSEMGKAIK